ncbi:MAG: TIGR03084 family metal-binding protein [Actinomycetota bacterium]|nr:TIGR03084 family metal-binding protein [Actinomycetota bacterium]
MTEPRAADPTADLTADPITDLIVDLAAEHDALDTVVAGLDAEQWTTPTPSPGWTVTDQVAHLSFFDDAAVTAIRDPERFAVETAELLDAVLAPGGSLDAVTLPRFRSLDPVELLAAWRDGRARMLEAAGTLRDGDRVPWYGPSMGARSFLTARLMETWAHGQDIVDAVGADRPATPRLVHVAQLGVITRSWSYRNRGGTAPEVEVRVELTGPDGAVHRWGPDAAEHVVTGDLEDFCLVVTQRRHLDDTSLEVTDGPAREWLLIAQVFAGGATDGPDPKNSQNERGAADTPK